MCSNQEPPGTAKLSNLCQSKRLPSMIDRKSTRLNSSHANISYAVFCLKKKKRRETGNLRIARSLTHLVPGAVVQHACVDVYEDASKLLADLGHETIDAQMTVRSASLT